VYNCTLTASNWANNYILLNDGLIALH